ncbi:MAG: HEAT repeat domain-containing protein [Bacteroidota bacterium]
MTDDSMKRKEWFTKILNIRDEELKPVLLLMVFSFFIGLSLSFYFTASNAIFLKHFSPKMIPVSFIASGIIICSAWYLFSRVDKKSSFSRQVTIKFLFVFLSVLAISIGVWAFDTAWLAFIMYTWVRIMVYITLVNFWGMAGKLFNIRQGKRIFGLISVGEVISIIIGYFSIPLILQFLKAPDLLFLASLSLFICLILVFIIFRSFKDQLQAVKIPSVPVNNGVQSEWNYWNLLKKPYFLVISLMALLPIFGYLFVDFLFLAQTKREFANNPETIARFFGIFLGFVAIVELIFKFVSGRFLNKYGLKPSLLSLPFILVFSILLAATLGTLYGTTGMFFAFIALARLFERSIRGAVYEPAFQLLYQPVPPEQRLPFQNQIEGIPKAFGTVITGVVILLLSSIPQFNLVYFNWVFIVVLGFWIWIALKMYDEYRNMLKSKLVGLKLENRRALDQIAPFISQSLSSAGDDKFQSLYSFYEKVEPAGIDHLLEKAFNDSTPANQLAILNKIRDKQYVPALGFIENQCDQNESPMLRETLEETRRTLRETEDLPFEYLVSQAHDKDAETRLRAALLLGFSGRYNTYKLLITLLKDPDPGVKKAALISSGRIKRYELWQYIIENLISPEFSNVAGVAVRIIGEPILSDLDRFFDKIADHKQTQQHIIEIIEAIGGEKSVRVLREKINYPDKNIRFKVLISLSNLEYHASVSEIPLIRLAIEESVETMVWLMASISDVAGIPGSVNLRQALLVEIEEKKEEVFLLLSLIYDPRTIRHIREHIESPDTNAKIYALEISDMMISEEIKELFFPIFEDITIHERLNRFSIRFPQEKLTFEERLIDIINKDYTKINKWTKACSIAILGEQALPSSDTITEILAANIVNPDPMLSELAAFILYEQHRTFFDGIISRLEKKDAVRSAALINRLKTLSEQKDTPAFHKVITLKNTHLFSPIPEIEIVEMLLHLEADHGDNGAVRMEETGVPDGWIINPGETDELHIPWIKLYETMSGNPILIERFVGLFIMKSSK